MEDRAESRKAEKTRPLSMKCAASSSLNLAFPMIRRKIKGSEKVILENTCCRLETPEFFRAVENIRMKLNPTLAIISNAWLFVNLNCSSPSIYLEFLFLISNN